MGKPPEIPDSGPSHDDIVDTIYEATNGIDFGPKFMNELLLFFIENVEDLFSGQTTFFILGGYDDYPLRRLHFAERELNSRPMTYAFVLCDLLDTDELKAYWEDRDKGSSFPLDDTAGDISKRDGDEHSGGEDSQPLSHCQFYLLARYSDYLVLIFEGRQAGPSVELGEVRNNFFDKSHVFRRMYEELEEVDIGSDTDIDPSELELEAGDKISSDVDITNPYSRPQEDLFALFGNDKVDRLYRWTYRRDIAEEIQKLPAD
jgi:hypothetical protein